MSSKKRPTKSSKSLEDILSDAKNLKADSDAKVLTGDKLIPVLKILRDQKNLRWPRIHAFLAERGVNFSINYLYLLYNGQRGKSAKKKKAKSKQVLRKGLARYQTFPKGRAHSDTANGGVA